MGVSTEQEEYRGSGVLIDFKTYLEGECHNGC